MKIKDVIQESVYDFFTKGTAAQQQAASVAQDRQKTYRAADQQQAAGQLKPNPARAAVQPQQQTQPVAGTWITTPDGVQIKPASGQNPTFARYNKQVYRLSNDDRWLDVRDRPISQTMMALLNNALEQL